MLKKILIALAALVLILVVLGLVLPADYSVSRSVVIAAEPGRVHELVGDLKRWPEWTPWQEYDPTVETTLGDVSAGVGASQSWTSASGEGRLRFTQCDAATGVAYDMAFIDDGHETPAQGSLTYRSAGAGTEVVWHMEGQIEMPVIGPYFALLMGSFVGPEFEKGLSKLKAATEKQ